MTKLFFVFLWILLSCSQASPQSHNLFAQARNEIEKKIAASGAEEIAVAVYDLPSKQTLLIHEKANFHAASTMKVPVMMELFRQAAAGKIDLKANLVIKNQFSSIVDQSPYQLNLAADSDQLPYQKIGQLMSLRELIERMITRSSNLATNLLIAKAGPENVMHLMKQLGAHDIQVRRGVEDTKAFEAGLNNTTTAYDLMILFRALAEEKNLSAKSCREMLAILEQQEFNEGIPAGLPKEARVAHKTGSITKIYHDAGIITLPSQRRYILVTLTRGFADQKRAHEFVAEISRMIYNAIEPAK